MLLSVRGQYRDGVVVPTEPVEGHDAEEVIITFLNDQTKPVPSVRETDYDALTKLLEECQIDTGISDLAHQHDHYLYGTPKREEP